MTETKSNDAWGKLFKKYDILTKIKTDGSYCIGAKEIKDFREPRLMAKWDSSEMLPSIFNNNKLNILPISRSEYILSDFNLYEEIPVLGEQVIEMQKIEVPNYESIDINNITSESNAINVLLLSKILDDFLSVNDSVLTFNGRMGTGTFDFYVNRNSRDPLCVSVTNAQCEIDAGLENDECIVILEAKNIVHKNFHVRQLYYPFRLWKNKVKKPIRLVFSIYYNQIYRLFEYKFEDENNYSSIKLVKTKNYSLQDTEITAEDLFSVYSKTDVKYDDNEDNASVPFIQANSFEKLISLMETLNEEQKTKEEVADVMQFDVRQSDYYFNAGKYLGLFEKENTVDPNGETLKKMFLTKIGKEVMKLNYKDRQLKLVELILQHKIFNVLFLESYESGMIPDAEIIERYMEEFNVCSSSLLKRRSNSVAAWLKWIYNLQNI